MTGHWLTLEDVQSNESSILGTYTAVLGEFYPISGTVVNCQNQPVEAGYVKMICNLYNI